MKSYSSFDFFQLFEYVKTILRGLPWWSSGQDSALPMQGARVRSLVGELDPACMPQLRVRMLQLKSPRAATKKSHAAMKIPCAATKTRGSQNK